MARILTKDVKPDILQQIYKRMAMAKLYPDTRTGQCSQCKATKGKFTWHWTGWFFCVSCVISEEELTKASKQMVSEVIEI